MRHVPVLVLAILLAIPQGAAVLPPNPVIVGPATIPDGETRRFTDGTFLVLGNVTVQSGGTLVFERAEVLFVGGPWTIRVLSGGTFHSVDSVLRADPTAEILEGPFGRDFGVVVDPGATLKLVGSLVEEGEGVDVWTSASTIHDVTFLRNEVGLTLHGVDVAMSDLNFTLNEVGLRVLGGAVEVSDSVFDQNEMHIHSLWADLVLSGSEVLAGVTGLSMLGGNAELAANWFDEHLGPDTLGVSIAGAESATLVDNTIWNWKTALAISSTPIVHLENNTIGSDGGADPGSITAQFNGPGMDATLLGNEIHQGTLRVWGDHTRDSLLAEGNSFLEASLQTTGIPVVARHNTVQRGTLEIRGGPFGATEPLSFLDNNTLTNAGESGILVAHSAVVVDNVVRNGGTCIAVGGTNALSARNLADGCRAGFSFWGAMVSEGDKAIGAPGVTIAGIDLNGAGGSIRNATATDAGSYGLQLGGGDATSGWHVANATLLRNANGVIVGTRAWDTRIIDTLIEDGWTGIAHEGAWGTAALFLDNTRIFDTVTAGLRMDWSCDTARSVVGINNWFQGNGFGVFAGCSAATLTQSYWGDPTGPSVASNPDGTGDAISASVAYWPFLESPP